MPKDQATCRDCPCCESIPGSRIALCWRPYPGPQVIDATTTGWCGDELMGDMAEGLTPRELWLSYHSHGRERLAEVGTILSLASVGSRTGAVGTAVAILQEAQVLSAREGGCDVGGVDYAIGEALRVLQGDDVIQPLALPAPKEL